MADEQFDTVGNIIAFEAGELDEEGIIALFTQLIRTGQVWQLQGFYGRTAMALIQEGHIPWEILDEPDEVSL